MPGRFKEDACGLSGSIPARLEEVDRAVDRIQKWLTDRKLAGHLFRFTLLMREALNNAVVHGAGSDPEKTVFFFVHRDKDRLFLCIKDPGPGFDPEGRPECTNPASVCPEHGWGVTIMRKYASRLWYDPELKATILAYALGNEAEDK
ncbi:MAG: ATP-binding protein [Desulfonatronovibrionaceae bacterium]